MRRDGRDPVPNSDQRAPLRGRGRRLVPAVVLVAALCLALALAPYAWVQATAWSRTATLETVPPQPVGLVLGAKVNPDGNPSWFLQARLDLAKQLYDRGKVQVLLVSGDNGQSHYNEPDAMRDYLIRQGVPASRVVADYAGFDTYDSCQRARRIFGVTRLTVVTQSYHLPRAVTLCRHAGIDTWGVGDSSVQHLTWFWYSGAAREIPAAGKVAWDVLSNRTPTLGPRETGVDDALRR